MSKQAKKRQTWQAIHQYEGIVFGYLKNAVGDSQTARDLFQDVYLAALEHLDDLDTTRSLKEWLITVARNKTINFYKRHRRNTYQELREDILATESEPADFSEVVGNAIDALPQQQRNAFILRSVDGWSYRELADHLNLSVSALTSLLKRARENFIKQYLIYNLPFSLRANAESLQLSDLIRFVDPFEPADILLERVEQKSQRYFNQIAENWAGIRDGFINNRKLRNILKQMPDFKHELAVDIGSGTGFIALHLALQNKRVVGMDMNRKMIKYLKTTRQGLKLAEFYLLRADARRLPFKNRIAHKIFLNLVLHHIPNPPLLIRRANDILHHDGYLVIVDFMHHKNKQMADQMHDLWMGFNPDSISKWADDAGLHLFYEDKWASTKDLELFCQIFKKADV
ncbi:MAG: sigma-70 family RNA polymerase sigma factor [Caldithrix sp.]|nr:sigma-70 family RNA polymerase sigma factor [Caldithrix sp.]